MIIDLSPVRDGSGPARLLDMVEGRSKQAFQQWLSQRDESWRQGLEVVAMDGFTGFTTATSEQLPEATPVMDPFHVVRLAGDARDECRRRVQQTTCGRRGRKHAPSTPPGGPCTPERTCSPTPNATASCNCSPPMNMPKSKRPGESTSA